MEMSSPRCSIVQRLLLQTQGSDKMGVHLEGANVRTKRFERDVLRLAIRIFSCYMNNTQAAFG